MVDVRTIIISLSNLQTILILANNNINQLRSNMLDYPIASDEKLLPKVV